jgi:hypothetical protein
MSTIKLTYPKNEGTRRYTGVKGDFKSKNPRQAGIAEAASSIELKQLY